MEKDGLNGRVLCIDPGEKRIGMAISDPLRLTARPLSVINHVSRTIDAASIVAVARENLCEMIVVGIPLEADGTIGFSGRKSERMADAIKSQANDLKIVLWDESGSTQRAISVKREMGVRKRDRSGHQDQAAAAVILQDYLDSNCPNGI